jgi:uncharacterized protein YjbI with pentapeptide repeats
MSEQPGQPQRPTADDRHAWLAYWEALAMPWRTEPEISEERQAYLTERRAVTPDIERGIYPFRDENGGINLTRADVEWLLATHESGGMRGPVDPGDRKQRGRTGLDLRGAELRGLNLRGLPLAGMQGGLTLPHEQDSTRKQRHMASVHLEGADLVATHLEYAVLVRARLDEANLRQAHLERANLLAAHLEGSTPYMAYLQGANLRRAFLDPGLHLEGATVSDRQYGGICLVDVRWNGANLAAVNWSQLGMVGEELEARHRPAADGTPKSATTRLGEYEVALRANRQLATVLRDQGLNEDADRFAYRAQLCQRIVLRRQRKVGAYLFSALLAALAGYGYRLWRILVAYGLALVVFAAAYFASGQWLGGTHLAWYEALLVSLTAIHGRVFFSSFGLDSVQSWVAAAESVVGIVIEGVFVAMLIQRFFAR